ncbi:helix-turn-helix transcriptional regulator [Bacillus sp. 1P10SD]|uniref:helix-turn-helix transcriptional regulator n=1 Tax=Bacillus sp. 1P10SD TaxID=3132265 RepID=UPI0039A5C757
MENRIKALRKEKKVSQDELAKICKVTRQTINAIENNKYDPSLSLAFCIADYLGVIVDHCFIYKQS